METIENLQSLEYPVPPTEQVSKCCMITYKGKCQMLMADFSRYCISHTFSKYHTCFPGCKYGFGETAKRGTKFRQSDWFQCQQERCGGGDYCRYHYMEGEKE